MGAGQGANVVATPGRATYVHARTREDEPPKFSSILEKRGSVQTWRIGDRPWSPPEERSSSALILPMSSTMLTFQLAPWDTGIGMLVVPPAPPEC